MRVRATVHAAERFVERVRPGMDPADAGAELERLISAFGRVVAEPEWLAGYTTKRPVYVEISDGIVVPVLGSWAVTVLVRSERSAESRARSAAWKSARRHAKHNGPHHDPRGRRRRRDEPVADGW